MPQQDLEVKLEELYMLIGEREVIRFKQVQEIARLNTQIEEMSRVISDLRNNNGKLVEPTTDDTV